MGKYFSDNFKSKYFDDNYSSPFGGSDTVSGLSDDNLSVEGKVNVLEGSLKNRGVDVPPMTDRSTLKRIVDAISFTTYPIMGALKNATDKDVKTTALQGAWEGLKASNPFGQGNPKGETTFSDVLTNFGWNYDKDKILTGNNVGKFSTGLAGDILLDPLTYLTFGIGGVLKGGVTSAARVGAKALARPAFEAGMKQLAEGGAERILQHYGQDAGTDMVKALTDKVTRTAGYEEKAGRGLSWGIGDNRITFVKDETMRKIGDATVAPYVNDILARIGDTKIGSGVRDIFKSSDKIESIKTARNNPEEYAKLLGRKMYENDLNGSFIRMQEAFKNKAYQLFDGIDVDTQKKMTDAMEKKGAFNLIRNEVLTGNTTIQKTKEAQEFYDGLVKMRNNVQNIVDDYTKFGDTANQITSYERILKDIDNIMGKNTYDFDKLVANTPVDTLATDNVVQLVNKYSKLSAPEIASDLAKAGVQNADDVAFSIRATIDKVLGQYDVGDYKYFTGQTLMPKVTKLENGMPMTEGVEKSLAEQVKEWSEAQSKNVPKQTGNKLASSINQRLSQVAEMEKRLIAQSANSKNSEAIIESSVNRELRKLGLTNEMYTAFKNNIEIGLQPVLQHTPEKIKVIDDMAKYFANQSKSTELSYRDAFNEWKYRLENMTDENLRNTYLAMQKEKQMINTPDMDMYNNTYKNFAEQDEAAKYMKDRPEYAGAQLTEKERKALQGYTSTPAEYKAQQEITKNALADSKDYKRLENLVNYMSNKGATKEAITAQIEKTIKNENIKMTIEDFRKAYAFKHNINVKPNVEDAGKYFTDSDMLIDWKGEQGKYFKEKVERPSTVDANGEPLTKQEQIQQAMQRNQELFDANLGESALHDTFNINGTKVYALAGSPQTVKVAMISKALKYIDKRLPPKFANYMGQLQVRLADISNWAEAMTMNKNILFSNDVKGGSLEEMSKRVVERIMPHEVAHNIGKSMYNDLFGNGAWKSITETEGKILKGAEFYNNKLLQEDFAESFAKYINSPNEFKAQYPQRFEAITKAIDDFVVPKTKGAIDRNVASKSYVMPSTAKHSAQALKAQAERDMENVYERLINNNISEEDAIRELEHYNNIITNEGNLQREFAQQEPGKYFHETVPETTLQTEVKMNDKAFANLVGGDKNVMNVMEEVKNEFYRMGASEGIEGLDDSILTYVAHMMRDKLTDGEKQILADKNINVGNFENVFAKDRKLKGTTKQINERIEKATGKKDLFETALGRIYLNRGLKHNQLVFNKQYYDSLVNEFGTHVKSVSDIPANRELYASTQDISRILGGVKTDDVDKILETLKISKDIKDTYKPIVKIDADAFVRLQQMDSSFSAFTLSDLLVADINKSGKVLYDESVHPLLALYDKFLQTWKISATAVNPGFHVRNFISNQFQNFLNVGMKIFDPKLQVQAAKLLGNDEKYLANTLIRTADGKTYTLQHIKEMMHKLGVVGEGQFADSFKGITQNNVDATGDITRRLTGQQKTDINAFINPLSPILDIRQPLSSLTKASDQMMNKQWLPYTVGRNVGSAVESQSRAFNFLANIVNGNDFIKSADNTNKFLFDYSDLSDIEAKVFKRIVPFYTWMRKNIPLQLEQLIKQPSTYKAYNFTKQEVENMIPEEDRLTEKEKNEFAQNWFQLPIQSTGKDKKHLNKESPTFYNPNLPLGDLDKIPTPTLQFLKQLFTSSSPMLKVPVEVMANKNVYFNSPISRGIGDSKDAPGYIQRLFGGTEKQPIQMSPEARYILQNASPALENLSKVLAVKNTDSDTANALTKWIGGQSVYSYDVDKYKEWAYRDRLKQLRDLQNKEKRK